MRIAELKTPHAAIPAEVKHPQMLEAFHALPFPDKKSEAYRYADLQSMWEQDLPLLCGTQTPPRTGQALVIVDGIVTEVPRGVEVRFADHASVDSEHHDPLYYLGHALSGQIIEVDVPDGTQLDIEHRLRTPAALIAYRIALKLQPNTQTAVTEWFVDEGAAGSMVLCGYDVRLPRDARLTMIKDQTIGADGYQMVASHALDVAEGATLHFGSFDFGSGSGVQQLRIVLGERAEIMASHLLYGADAARRGTVSHIVHRGAHSTSRQIAKNILRDTARGIFDAIILVEPTARYTKAHQNNKAILLNDGAYMASKPQLEIHIDELEASHGSTTGQLDRRQLFYLRSRGISEEEARKMLILAFANEIIDTIADTKLREQVRGSFEEAYYAPNE
jgi:Fe-S cluster assembly protein SufD